MSQPSTPMRGARAKSEAGLTFNVYVTVTFQQLSQIHWRFYQPLNWAWLGWVRRKTHSVVWGLMEQRGTTCDNFKWLYSHISQITYHIAVRWTSIQLHYTIHDSNSLYTPCAQRRHCFQLVSNIFFYFILN